MSLTNGLPAGMIEGGGGFATSPALYPQKFDSRGNRVLLVRLDAEAYRKASFLDDRILDSVRGAWVPYPVVAKAARAAGHSLPLHFIFHAGHVGSTLLTRLLEETPGVLALREPLPLRTLADAHDSLQKGDGTPGKFEEQLETFLALWGRGFDDTRLVVVKATSSTARLAPSLLTARPHARCVYLNVAAESFLATLLAGANSAADLHGHAIERLRRLKGFLGPSASRLQVASLGEVAAMSWLTARLTQQSLSAAFGGRVLSIDFDDFLSHPGIRFGEVLAHFGIDEPFGYLAGIADSPAMRSYSKAPERPYSAGLRTEILAAARLRHAAEIRKALRWLDELATRYEIVAAARDPA